MNLSLWDTAGQEEFDKLRPLSYPGSDIVCICFSLVDEQSLQNTREKWLPEVQDNIAGVPIFLVGLKADLRDEMPDVAVTTDKGEALVTELGATQYWEVSAKTHTHVDELFFAAVDVVLTKRKGESQAAAAAAAESQAAAASQKPEKSGCCTLL